MEHTTISGITMGLQPQIADRKQTLASKPRIGHPGLGRQGLRQMPVGLATDRCQDRLTSTGSQSQQVPSLGPCPTPLSQGRAGDQRQLEFPGGIIVDAGQAGVWHPLDRRGQAGISD